MESGTVFQVDQAASEDKEIWGTSENAVRIQIYCVIIIYCFCGYYAKWHEIGTKYLWNPANLDISLTDKTRLRDLFDKKNINKVNDLYGSSKPNLFNF